MHAPPAFRVTDHDTLAALIAERPLATIAINGPAGPLAAHVPLVAKRAADGAIEELMGHVARANPLWQAVDDGPGGTPALTLFHGADGYVSPAWYPSKAEHGKVVPTWNYVRVEIRGILRVEPDPRAVAEFVRLPTDTMEARRLRDGGAEPWTLEDAPADYIESMLRGVVGVRLTVTEAAGVWKLSQNRSDADRDGAVAGVRSTGNEALADLMSPSGSGRHSRGSP